MSDTPGVPPDPDDPENDELYSSVATGQDGIRFPANRGIAGDLPQITHALSGESAAVRLGYVERGPLDRALAQLNSSNLSGQNCTAAWELGDLVGLETWLQVFLGQPSPHRGSYGPTA